MRIALLCDSYPPSRNSAAVQIRDLAAEFARQGHDIHVIVPDEAVNGPLDEMVGGVRVIRLPSPRKSNMSRVRRAVAESLMPVTMILGLMRSSLQRKRWDAVIWYSPSIFLWPVVLWLQGIVRCCKYLILRDMFPEWARDLGLLRPGPAYAYFWVIARVQYWIADTIGVQSESNLSFLDGWTRGGRRVEVLHNWLEPSKDEGCSIQVARTPLAGRKIMVYIGNMGIAQGMAALVDLARSIVDRKDVGFLFVGRGSEVSELRRAVADQGLDNVLFFDEIDTREMAGLLAQCSVGLIALDPKHRSHNIPGKFLTYLQAGIPVLARINEGTDLEALIVRENVGRAYTGSSIPILKAKAIELLDDSELRAQCGENGRRLAQRLFTPAGAVACILRSVGARVDGGVR